MKRLFFVFVFLFGGCNVIQGGIVCNGQDTLTIDTPATCQATYVGLIGFSPITRAVTNVYADWYNAQGDYYEEMQGSTYNLNTADSAVILEFPITLSSTYQDNGFLGIGARTLSKDAVYRRLRVSARFYRQDGTVTTQTVQIPIRY
jgi:hypothetical protein